MINLRHLSYFVAVVEAGSLSRAAQVIHVAQPSLSQQIAALESDAGATLLQRSTRGVRPTPEGEALYREALAILRRVEDLPTTIRQSPGEITGVVTLGMSTTLASTFAGEILTEATRALPGVRIVLSSSDSERAAAAIAARDVDLGVVFEATPLPRLIRRALFEQRLFVFGATSDILGRAVESRLRDVAVVLPAAPNVTRTAFDQAFARHGMAITPAIEAMTYSDIVTAVRSGEFVTLIPKGDLDETTPAMAQPVPLEPAVTLTAVIVSSDEFPLSRAADAVSAIAERIITHHVGSGALRGAKSAGRPTRAGER